MAKSNIIYRSYRLNLDNEQHRRVNKVLAELNTDIHKSVNQFITDAIDFYTNSFGDESLLKETGEQKKKEEEYISKRDLDGIREELKNDVKTEIIMLLGAALGGGAARVAEGSMGRMVMENVANETAVNNTEEPADSTMMELVDNWG